MSVRSENELKSMKILPVLLLLFIHLLMSYNASIFPWRALLGSVLLIAIGRLVWPAEWKDRFGLRIPSRDIILSIVQAPILMILLYWIIWVIASGQGILYQPPFTRHCLLSPVYAHTLGQTLNEELLFGALFLYAIRQKFPQSHSLVVAALVASGFSLLHYVFYRWMVISQYGGILTIGTLFVLFVIGLLRNTLILKSGHIGYSWSLHFSINLIGLTAGYTFGSGKKLIEPEIFNLILGAPAAVFLSIFILAACSVSLLRKRPSLAASC